MKESACDWLVLQHDGAGVVAASEMGGTGSDGQQGEEEGGGRRPMYDCMNYRFRDVLDAAVLFESQDEAFEAWDDLLVTEHGRFDPVGCTLAVPLPTFENQEEPYFYDLFFNGFDQDVFKLQYVYLDVTVRSQELRKKIVILLFIVVFASPFLHTLRTLSPTMVLKKDMGHIERGAQVEGKHGELVAVEGGKKKRQENMLWAS